MTAGVERATALGSSQHAWNTNTRETGLTICRDPVDALDSVDVTMVLASSSASLPPPLASDSGDVTVKPLAPAVCSIGTIGESVGSAITRRYV